MNENTEINMFYLGNLAEPQHMAQKPFKNYTP